MKVSNLTVGLVFHYKEFVHIDFQNASEEAFGSTVCLLGDFKSGETLAKHGVTVVHDFETFGDEWQAFPTDDMLFHPIQEPQFPKRCLSLEDLCGQCHRRLGELHIVEEDAE